MFEDFKKKIVEYNNTEEGKWPRMLGGCWIEKYLSIAPFKEVGLVDKKAKIAKRNTALWHFVLGGSLTKGR